MDGPQVEWLAKRERFARTTKDEIARIDHRFAGNSSAFEIACECGRSGCADVIALPRSVYEQARREPRRLVLVPGHELPKTRHVLSRYDGFVVVAKEEPATATIAE